MTPRLVKLGPKCCLVLLWAALLGGCAARGLDGPPPTDSPSPAKAAATETQGLVPCGVGAVYLLLDRLGDRRPLTEVSAACSNTAQNALSLADLAAMFERFGYEARGYQFSRDVIAEIPRPCIALLRDTDPKIGHFVVIEPCSGGVLYLDPLGGTGIVKPAELCDVWTGKILMATGADNFRSDQ